MKNLTNLAGEPGEHFNQGESMSGGNTMSAPAYGTAPGTAPVNAPLVEDKVDSPKMQLPGTKDLTHLVSANGVKNSPATWKKAGE